MVECILRGSYLLHPAAIKDYHHVSHGEGFHRVVSNENYRNPEPFLDISPFVSGCSASNSLAISLKASIRLAAAETVMVVFLFCSRGRCNQSKYGKAENSCKSGKYQFFDLLPLIAIPLRIHLLLPGRHMQPVLPLRVR